jgi:hypothetical protein
MHMGVGRGDLILSVLDCIVTVSFGVCLVLWLFYWFCNVCVCVCVLGWYFDSCGCFGNILAYSMEQCPS